MRRFRVSGFVVPDSVIPQIQVPGYSRVSICDPAISGCATSRFQMASRLHFLTQIRQPDLVPHCGAGALRGERDTDALLRPPRRARPERLARDDESITQRHRLPEGAALPTRAVHERRTAADTNRAQCDCLEERQLPHDRRHRANPQIVRDGVPRTEGSRAPNIRAHYFRTELSPTG